MEPTPTPDHAATLRPICFVIMPYGRKPTHSTTGPTFIDYDALWDKALFPLIDEDLQYHAVRADQDLGALIIQEMIERLTLADLVIAELTTPNANVYYEIGIRHAAKEKGCVLISADWAQPLFDLAQIRQVRYPLPEGEIEQTTAAGIRQKLAKMILPHRDGVSPVFKCIPGYPGNSDMKRSAAFRSQIEALSRFSTEVRAVRLLPAKPADERVQATEQLLQRYRSVATTLPAVALELIYLLRDSEQWQQTVTFIDSLPQAIQQLSIVKEQRSLAQSKSGDHLAAIAALEELIQFSGDSSERRGLLGGRYKKLYKETSNLGYLNKAIAEYDRGMRVDLNDYYPSSNLARLLRKRGQAGDEKKAQAAATVALMACGRARKLNPADEWLLPTLLGMAFEAGNVESAQKLYEEMGDNGAQPFHLATTIPDLEMAIELTKDAAIAAELAEVLDAIRVLG